MSEDKDQTRQSGPGKERESHTKDESTGTGSSPNSQQNTETSHEYMKPFISREKSGETSDNEDNPSQDVRSEEGSDSDEASGTAGADSGISGEASRDGSAGEEGEVPPSESEETQDPLAGTQNSYSESREPKAASEDEAAGGTAPAGNSGVPSSEASEPGEENWDVSSSTGGADEGNDGVSSSGTSGSQEGKADGYPSVSSEAEDREETAEGTDPLRGVEEGAAASTATAGDTSEEPEEEQEAEASRAEKKRKEREEGTYKRGRVRLFPIWLRLVLLVLALGVSLVLGAMIGFWILGDGGNPMEVFNPQTWFHIYDIIFEGTESGR